MNAAAVAAPPFPPKPYSSVPAATVLNVPVLAFSSRTWREVHDEVNMFPRLSKVRCSHRLSNTVAVAANPSPLYCVCEKVAK